MDHTKIQSRNLARSLVENPDWVDAICDCDDTVAKRWVLYACAKAVLPYWESRFQRDDSMSNMVECMAMAANDPSPQNDANLRSAIPDRRQKKRDLSAPPRFFENQHSDCPADFAGDSVFRAAIAFTSAPGNEHADYAAIETAKECLARVFVERDAQYDDDTDYQGIAETHLRRTMLETLSEAAIEGTLAKNRRTS